MTENWQHIPILAEEIAQLLLQNKSGFYLDGTLGLGGHTKLFLTRLDSKAKILGIDKDSKAIEFAVKRVDDARLITHQGSYLEAPKILKELNLPLLDGALFDLGLSSYQLDDARRGFSFLKDGPLDMRFDNTKGKTAADLVNTLTADKLEYIFQTYGEERAAKKIALAICQARREKPFNSTQELAALIEKNIPRFGKTHPATRIFQALRIAVNEELNTVEQAPKMLEEIIKPGGRAAFLTFHSLEDRIIKQAFKEMAKGGKWKLVNKKIINPSFEEIKANSRSRSAGLRVIERCAL
ncbi:MAG: 16S rRNA (cytosine(1402)-N(4))-methyltransferase RsmH [Elusimicrobiaceae bacterium]|nr:16S rRNA (cytosine(1402)-N(4))-methyltransferase RsmH [Elusimicrobiaceae bacterium]